MNQQIKSKPVKVGDTVNNHQSQNNNRLIDAEALGAELGFSAQQIWRLHRVGKIPCVKLGHRCIRYNLQKVITALGKCTLEETTI